MDLLKDVIVDRYVSYILYVSVSRPIISLLSIKRKKTKCRSAGNFFDDCSFSELKFEFIMRLK